MKNLKLLSVFILFALFSCNAEENACETTLNQQQNELAISNEFAKVQKQMISLNEEITAENRSQTRSVWGWFKRISVLL